MNVTDLAVHGKPPMFTVEPRGERLACSRTLGLHGFLELHLLALLTEHFGHLGAVRLQGGQAPAVMGLEFQSMPNVPCYNALSFRSKRYRLYSHGLHAVAGIDGRAVYPCTRRVARSQDWWLCRASTRQLLCKSMERHNMNHLRGVPTSRRLATLLAAALSVRSVCLRLPRLVLFSSVSGCSAGHLVKGDVRERVEEAALEMRHHGRRVAAQAQDLQQRWIADEIEPAHRLRPSSDCIQRPTTQRSWRLNVPATRLPCEGWCGPCDALCRKPAALQL